MRLEREAIRGAWLGWRKKVRTTWQRALRRGVALGLAVVLGLSVVVPASAAVPGWLAFAWTWLQRTYSYWQTAMSLSEQRVTVEQLRDLRLEVQNMQGQIRDINNQLTAQARQINQGAVDSLLRDVHALWARIPTALETVEMDPTHPTNIAIAEDNLRGGADAIVLGRREDGIVLGSDYYAKLPSATGWRFEPRLATPTLLALVDAWLATISAGGREWNEFRSRKLHEYARHLSDIAAQSRGIVTCQRYQAVDHDDGSPNFYCEKYTQCSDATEGTTWIQDWTRPRVSYPSQCPTLVTNAPDVAESTVNARYLAYEYEQVAAAWHSLADKPSLWGAENLSLGALASQSSTGWGGDAERAVDGNTDGDWNSGSDSVTHTAPQNGEPWWQVDLGATARIYALDLWNRTDCCSERLNNFYVFLSDAPLPDVLSTSGSTPQGVERYGPFSSNADPAAPTRVWFTQDNRPWRPVRYVRVQLRATGSYLSLAEVMVWGAHNIALAGSAWQTSTGAGGTADRAIDGNTDGYYWNGSVTHTEQEWEPYWELDLGASARIGSIDIWNRTDWCGWCLDGAVLFVSDVPFTERWLDSTWVQEGVSHYALDVGNPRRITVGRTGRYLRIQVPGQAYFSLAEVRVWGLTNRAQGKWAWQSSDWVGATADRAVDGNIDGEFWNGSVTHTAYQAKPTWGVDLGTYGWVDTVEVWNRTDCCGDRLNGLQVFVSNVPIDPATAAWSRVPGDWVRLLPNQRRYSFPVGRIGRYVYVQLPGSQELSLAEVRVFGRD